MTRIPRRGFRDAQRATAIWRAMIMNGPGRSFGGAEGQPLTATIGADFKTAEARGTVSPLFSSEQFQIDVKFNCR